MGPALQEGVGIGSQHLMGDVKRRRRRGRGTVSRGPRDASLPQISWIRLRRAPALCTLLSVPPPGSKYCHLADTPKSPSPNLTLYPLPSRCIHLSGLSLIPQNLLPLSPNIQGRLHHRHRYPAKVFTHSSPTPTWPPQACHSLTTGSSLFLHSCYTRQAQAALVFFLDAGNSSLTTPAPTYLALTHLPLSGTATLPAGPSGPALTLPSPAHCLAVPLHFLTSCHSLPCSPRHPSQGSTWNPLPCLSTWEIPGPMESPSSNVTSSVKPSLVSSSKAAAYSLLRGPLSLLHAAAPALTRPNCVCLLTHLPPPDSELLQGCVCYISASPAHSQCLLNE